MNFQDPDQRRHDIAEEVMILMALASDEVPPEEWPHGLIARVVEATRHRDIYTQERLVSRASALARIMASDEEGECER